MSIVDQNVGVVGSTFELRIVWLDCMHCSPMQSVDLDYMSVDYKVMKLGYSETLILIRQPTHHQELWTAYL